MILHAPSCGPSVGDTDRWFLCSGCMNSAVDGLPIKAQVLPGDSITGSMTEGVPGESRADELVWVAGCAGLLGRVLRSTRYDAQSERGLARRRRSPLARVLKTFGRLISCIQTSYKADEWPMHSLYRRECIPQAFFSCLWTPVEISWPKVAPSRDVTLRTICHAR